MFGILFRLLCISSLFQQIDPLGRVGHDVVKFLHWNKSRKKSLKFFFYKIETLKQAQCLTYTRCGEHLKTFMHKINATYPSIYFVFDTLITF